MAASIRMRPTVLQTLYFNRTSCIVCKECLHAAYSTVVANSEGGQSSGLVKEPIRRGEVIIPKKKKRDSLSILKALASTVGKDPTAPRYVFIDDPTLVPRNFAMERVLLSKASGKRAARFMVNEYKMAFDHETAAPPVKAFQPFDTEYKYKDVSIDALKERIARREVMDAIEEYKRLEEEGKDVSNEVKLSFLELLCVFGCKNPLPKLMPEEKVVDKFVQEDDEDRLKISMDIAEEVFHSLPEKTVDAYNWITRGMAKVKLSKGCKHYEEMKNLKIPVYLGTYNQLIDFLFEQNVDRLKEVTKYLREMKNEGISPNLETFHSVLRALRYTTNKNYAKDVPAILAEMKVLNLEPTLYTWTLVLNALVPEGYDRSAKQGGNNIRSDIVEIINHIRRRGVDKYQIDHPQGNFFKEAMKQCRKYVDTDAALMLYELRDEMGYKYITTSLRDDQIFYENLLALVCRTETPEKMMEVYNRENPYQKYINPRCIQLVLENIETFSAYEHLPQIWQDLNNILTAPFAREGILVNFLNLLASPNVQPELGKDFVHIAKSLFEDCKDSDSKLSFDLIGDQITNVFINNMELDLAWESAMYIYQKEIPGFIDGNTLARVLELSLMEKDASKIMSFCELPQDVKGTMTPRAYELISQYRDNAEACLTHPQIEQLQDAFFEVQTL